MRWAEPGEPCRGRDPSAFVQFVVEGGCLGRRLGGRDRCQIVLGQLPHVQRFAISLFQPAVFVGRQQHQTFAAMVGDGDGLSKGLLAIAPEGRLELGGGDVARDEGKMRIFRIDKGPLRLRGLSRLRPCWAWAGAARG